MAKDIVKEMQKELKDIATEASKGEVVEDIMAEPKIEEEKEEVVEEKKVDEPEVIEEQEENEKVEGQDDDPEFMVSDDVVESAIRAGMSYSDILQLNDEELIGRMIGVSTKKDDETKNDTPESDEPMDLSFLDIDDIFELEDPAAVFTGIKETISVLADQISALKNQRQQDVLIDGTSELMSKLKPEQRDKVREKMEVLSKGYRQSGVNVSSSDIFDEASKLALGGTLSKDAINKLTSRSKKTIQRVPGKSGTKVKRALTEDEARDKVLEKMEKQMDAWSK